LTDAGRPDLIGLTLIVCNFGQLPSSLLIMALTSRIERRVWPYLFAGSLALASTAVVISSASSWTVIAIGTLGFASGISLALGLALPPLLSTPAQVGRVSAVMFMLSFTYAMVVSVICGVAWDLTGRASSTFVVTAVSILPLMLLIPTIQFHRS
jgi:CP family cyanate transporter-like MFS transporter